MIDVTTRFVRDEIRSSSSILLIRPCVIYWVFRCLEYWYLENHHTLFDLRELTWKRIIRWLFLDDRKQMFHSRMFFVRFSWPISCPDVQVTIIIRSNDSSSFLSILRYERSGKNVQTISQYFLLYVDTLRLFLAFIWISLKLKLIRVNNFFIFLSSACHEFFDTDKWSSIFFRLTDTAAWWWIGPFQLHSFDYSKFSITHTVGWSLDLLRSRSVCLISIFLLF